MKKMKRILTTLLIALVSLIAVVGCSKPESDPQPNNDKYYVKYVFSCMVVQYSQLYTTSYTVDFTDSYLEKQTRDYKTTAKQEIICGPFRYGATINILLKHFYYDHVGGSSNCLSTIEVYISKNDSPFVLRKTESSSSQEPYTTSLEYTIDY